VAIFLITALSAGFFAGFQSAAPSMEETADAYISKAGLADYRLYCDTGITAEDADAIAALPEVSESYPAYNADVVTTIGSESNACAMHSIAADAPDDLLTLVKGRMPESPDECVVDADASGAEIGDTVAIGDDNKEETLSLLAQRSFTVVGLVRSAAYISAERGNTDIALGRISYFLYVPEAAFTGEYYTELNLRLKDAEGVSVFSDEYKQIVADASGTLEGFGQQRADIRYAEIQEEAQQELSDAEQEYQEKKESSAAELADAEKRLKKGTKKLKKQQKSYDESLNELNKKRPEIEAAKKELAASRKKLDDGKKQLKAASAKLAKASAGRKALNKQKRAIEAALAVETDPAKIAALNAQLLAVQKQSAKLEAQIKKGKAQLAAQRKKLKAGEADYKKGQASIKSAEAQILTAEKKLETAHKELESANAELAKGKTEYDAQAAEADTSFEEAQEEIDEGREELSNLEKPEWFMQDRQDFPGYSALTSDVERIRKIALIIPWFLLLVAALVCLTTMTRMVEAQRTQTGTLKALGYAPGNVRYMYQCYTWFVGILGGAIGVVAGVFVFPGVVFGAYGLMYHLGAFTLKIEPIACLIGLFGGAIAISIATAIACRHTVKDKVAVLMRPKAPQPGRRVLLERIPFLWRGLPFGMKVTLRNLFRYKNRFFMTVLGVAGCAALLLTGFGLRDSISGLIDVQFEEIAHYRTTIILKEGSGAPAETELNTKLSGYDSAYVHIADADASAGDRTNSGFITYLYVPEDPEGLNRFLTFRERVGQTPVAFPPDPQDGPSAVISERLATVLDLQIGDTMRFTPSGSAGATGSAGVVGSDGSAGSAEMKQAEVRIAGVMENYIYNYIYITPTDYQTLFGELPAYTSVIMDSDIPQEEFDALMANILESDNVASAVNISQGRETSKNMVDNLSAIVWAIIFVACLLALIVLYNLVNINITERERELATLKVLGFTRNEVDAYISRETTILTVLGAAIGLGAGIFLHRYVMVSIEVNEVMFARTILPQSYLYAAAFTLGCGFLIRLAMRPRLNKIDPVSSLKSVD